MSQLLIIETGEYSDFTYTPLVVPETFDMKAAKLAFMALLRQRYPDNLAYTIDAPSLTAWLSTAYHDRARNLEVGDVVTHLGVLEDPLHYGSWDPVRDDQWPKDYRD